MKIVHLVWGMTNGGIENMLSDIVRYQVESADIHIIVINDIKSNSIIDRIDPRCQMHFINRPVGSKNPFYLLLLHFVLWRIKPDVLHFHGDMYKFIRTKAKVRVFTAHNLSWGEKNVPKMDAYIAISSAVYTNLVENGYKNVIQINNGIDFSLIKQRSYLPCQFLRIVQTGRLILQYKGQDILISAIADLVRQGIKNVHVDFIGDGESREILQKMVTDNKLEDYVTFLGERSREYIYEHLADYNVFVQASRWEGFGLTVAEAIAANLPVVIAKHEGPMQIVDGGKYGRAFDIEDSAELGRILKDVLENYPSQASIEEAYEYAAKNFSIKQTVNQYMSLYSQLMK